MAAYWLSLSSLPSDSNGSMCPLQSSPRLLWSPSLWAKLWSTRLLLKVLIGSLAYLQVCTIIEHGKRTCIERERGVDTKEFLNMWLSMTTCGNRALSFPPSSTTVPCLPLSSPPFSLYLISSSSSCFLTVSLTSCHLAPLTSPVPGVYGHLGVTYCVFPWCGVCAMGCLIGLLLLSRSDWLRYGVLYPCTCAFVSMCVYVCVCMCMCMYICVCE